MGRHLKHCKRGSGKSKQKTNSTHALPSQGIDPVSPVPKKRQKRHTRSSEAVLRRNEKKIAKQLDRLAEEADDLHSLLANTATDAVATCSASSEHHCAAGVAANRSHSEEQHSAAGEAALYAVDLESSTSEDLPHQGEEWAEFSAGGSPAAEDPYQ